MTICVQGPKYKEFAVKNLEGDLEKVARCVKGLELSQKETILEHLHARGLINTQKSGCKYIYSFPSSCHATYFSYHPILPHI